ncbi:MAG: metallophosphoesterase family protein, partial [Nanoarchaeota archaeon]
MNKTLIISDIHTHIGKADKIIKFEKADLNILVGDYFDEFYDNPQINSDAADWLNFKLKDPKFVCLMGNHDIHYIY